MPCRKDYLAVERKPMLLPAFKRRADEETRRVDSVRDRLDSARLCPQGNGKLSQAFGNGDDAVGTTEGNTQSKAPQVVFGMQDFASTEGNDERTPEKPGQ